MKYVLVLVLFVLELFSSVLESKILSVDNEKNIATIKIEKTEIGMSGYIVHKFTNTNSSILRNIVVKSFDKESKIAVLKMSKFDDLKHNALPIGLWKVKVGDTAVLAFAYSRAVLIAPNADVYHTLTRGTSSIQWIHPDIFATTLSSNGHPTPLKEDFDEMSVSSTVGLYFFYIQNKLFTVDARSFKILNISDTKIEQKNTILPFYSRVDKIDAAWWGEGSNYLENYEPYYYELLLTYNKDDKKLQTLIEKFKQRINNDRR